MPALLLPLLADWRILAAIGLILGCVGFVAWEKHAAYVAGEARATAKIELANRLATQKARRGSLMVETCLASGGVWDRLHGRCAYPSGN
jgi:hypothetical protein